MVSEYPNPWDFGTASDFCDNLHCYRPQRSWGKVMFLHVSVILFTGGFSRPTPRGRLRDLTGGYQGPHPGGPGPGRGCVPACTETDPPFPRDSYWCGWFASYWNAFLLPFTIGAFYGCTHQFSSGVFFCKKYYRSGTVNSNTVNSKFHLIWSFFEISARILSFHV